MPRSFPEPNGYLYMYMAVRHALLRPSLIAPGGNLEIITSSAGFENYLLLNPLPSFIIRFTQYLVANQTLPVFYEFSYYKQRERGETELDFVFSISRFVKWLGV